MEIPDLFWPLALALGCIQGLFLGLVLARFMGPHRVALSALALLVVVCALMIGEEWAVMMEVHNQVPHVLYSSMMLPLLIGPLFLVHAQALVEGKARLTWQDAWHGLPFVLGVLYFLPLYGLEGEAKLSAMRLGTYRADILLWAYLKGLHVVLYLVAALRILRRPPREGEASEEAQYLQWPRRLIGVALIGLVGIYGLLTLMLLGVEGLMDSDRFGSLFMASVIYLLTFIAIRHPRSLVGHVIPVGVRTDAGMPLPSLQEAEPRSKYARSSLQREQQEGYVAALRQYMQSQPYRDPELRLETVAQELGLSTHHLSQVVNEGCGVTFRDLVNTYRVEAVAEALLDPEQAHKSVLALAFEAGFSSKASFNRVFKRHMGLTPTGYRQQQQASA